MKKAVCAIILDLDGKILTVSRKNDFDDIGLPGGKVDKKESPHDAIKREVLEETGFHIKVMYPIYSNDDEFGFYVTTYICCLDKSKPYTPSKESGIVSMRQPKELLNGTFKRYNRKLLTFLNLI